MMQYQNRLQQKIIEPVAKEGVMSLGSIDGDQNQIEQVGRFTALISLLNGKKNAVIGKANGYGTIKYNEVEEARSAVDVVNMVSDPHSSDMYYSAGRFKYIMNLHGS